MKKVLSIFPIFLLICFGLRRTSASFFSVTEYRVIQTGLISDAYFSSIKTCVGQLLGDNNGDASALIKNLKNTFPLLSKIIVAYRPCGTYVMTYAHKPVCCINDDLILTDQHELFPKNSFAAHACDSIAHISVAQECVSKVSALVPSLLRELPSYFNETYDLELVNERYVRLVDKQEKNFSIMAFATQKNLGELLAHCGTVKKIISERKGYDKKSTWINDIRFKDYVVAYKV